MTDKKRTGHSPPPLTHDVAIIGGGPAGLSLACLLARGGKRVACIDRESPAQQISPVFDGRTTAISLGSRRILERAGVWNDLGAQGCPIHQILITDGDSPTLVTFDHREAGGEPFGWIVENRHLRRVLFARAAGEKNIDHIAPATVTALDRDDEGVTVTLADGGTIRAALLVGADGRQSFVRQWAGLGARQWSYRQRAIICTVEHDHPHNNIAIENFRPEGPFAVLPLTDGENGAHRSSVVWTEHGPDRASALHYDDATFNAALTARFPAFYGAARQIGQRAAYPLGLVHAHDYAAPRTVLVGDAAHGIHPIAGQGLNLGFRDIAVLATLAAAAPDAGAESVTAAYQRARRPDNMAMAGTTDLLNRLFSNNVTPVRALRRLGLRLVDRTPPVKKFFMAQAMGLGSGMPGLLGDLMQDRDAA